MWASDSFTLTITDDVCSAACNPLGFAATDAGPADATSRQITPLSALPCRYRQGETGDTVECSTCGEGGRVRLKVFNCDVYGRCTIDRKAGDIAVCLGCTSRVPPGPEDVA